MAFPLTLDKYKFTEFAAEIMVYFEKHKLLEIISRLIAEVHLRRPSDPAAWMAENIGRIANKIYSNCLQISYDSGGDVKFFQLPGKFLHRLLIFGRSGSGRKTMARLLVKRLGLVLIDVDNIIQRTLCSESALASELRNVINSDNIPLRSKVFQKLIARRLLQSDALYNGWVMINYPHDLKGFQELLENSKIPPNRIVYLQCSEDVAVKRLIQTPYLSHLQATCEYIEREMKHYRVHEESINEFLRRRHETIFIDATKCYEIVKNQMMNGIQQLPYLMGYKY